MQCYVGRVLFPFIPLVLTLIKSALSLDLNYDEAMYTLDCYNRAATEPRIDALFSRSVGRSMIIDLSR